MKMPNWWQTIIRFFKEVFQNYSQDDAFILGASLAYYTVFSFAPLLVIIIAVAGYFLGDQAVQGKIFEQLSDLLGTRAAENLENIVSNAHVSDQSLLATIIGIGTLILGATGVFNALKNSLNRVWEIEPRPENNILFLIFNRVLSFSFALGLGFLFLVTLAVNAFISGFAERIAELLPGTNKIYLTLYTYIFSLAVTGIIFSLLFKFLPDAKVRWGHTVIGGLFTAFLFLIGKSLIGLYIGNSNFSSTYGTAAALITLLVWTYYNSQILFLGAEFTYVYAKWRGSPVMPASNAVKVVRRAHRFEKEEEEVTTPILPEEKRSPQ